MLLIEAVLSLLISKTVVELLPFRLSKRIFNYKIRRYREIDNQYLMDLKHSVERANRIAIWNNVCIVKSFAARFMLQRRGIPSQIHLGVQIQEGKKISAHAWLTCNGLLITPRGDNSFKEIYCF